MREEDKDQPRTEYFIVNVSMDPLDDCNIRLRAIAGLGYPIEYKNHSVFAKTGKQFADAYADTNQHWLDVRNLDYLIRISGIGNFLGVISSGNPHRLAKLIKGNEEEFYDLSPQSSRGMNPDGRYKADSQLLKRFYLTAYGRYYQLLREGGMYFALDPKRGYGPFTATPDESDTALYDVFSKQGVTPISAEELIELAKGEGEKIIAQGLDKRRSVMEFRTQAPFNPFAEEPAQTKRLQQADS